MGGGVQPEGEESSQVGGVESGWRRTARERSPASGVGNLARWEESSQRGEESSQVGGVESGRRCTDSSQKGEGSSQLWESREGEKTS